jgi:hypothetical protein
VVGSEACAQRVAEEVGGRGDGGLESRQRETAAVGERGEQWLLGPERQGREQQGEKGEGARAPQDETLSSEMSRRFIISWSVVGLSCSSSAACFCTPPAASSARSTNRRS